MRVRDEMKHRILFCDGGMGSLLQAQGLGAGELPETWNIKRPEAVSYTHLISVKRNYPKGDKFSMGNLLKQISVSFWALAAVLIVVVGVLGGVFTATESAAIAVIYSLIVSVFSYKGLDWKGVWNVLGDCVDTLSIVLIPVSYTHLLV